MKKRNFSVIEVLVVMAVSATLITMIVSSVKTSKDVAIQATCMSNIAQIRNITELYRKDNTSLPYSEIWLTDFSFAKDYLEEGNALNIFKCPGSEDSEVTTYDQLTHNTSYYYVANGAQLVKNIDDASKYGISATQADELIASQNGIIYDKSDSHHNGKVNIAYLYKDDDNDSLLDGKAGTVTSVDDEGLLDLDGANIVNLPEVAVAEVTVTDPLSDSNNNSDANSNTDSNNNGNNGNSNGNNGNSNGNNGNSNGNNGHGNNEDGVDSSNPGNAPFTDSDPTVDDENGNNGNNNSDETLANNDSSTTDNTTSSSDNSDTQTTSTGDSGTDSDNNVDVTIEDDTIILNEETTAIYTVLGAAISYGGQYDMAVTTQFQITSPDGSTEATPVFGEYDDAVDGNVNNGEQQTYSPEESYPAGTVIETEATSWKKKKSRYDGESSNHWKVYMEVDDSNDTNTKILSNGDAIPNMDGYLDQGDVESFLEGYINEDGSMNLADNQVIILFELGTTNMSSSAADFQDLVILVTFVPAK